jgi:hypothetical protein
MLREMLTRHSPSAGSRPVAIGSRSIGVSLQPAIPRRVAPQQSPLPLHRSPSTVAQSRSARQSNRCSTALQGCSPGRARRVRRQRECHLYFARRVSFLSCADRSYAEIQTEVIPALALRSLGCSAVDAHSARACSRDRHQSHAHSSGALHQSIVLRSKGSPWRMAGSK